jgi:hypothetical protein
VFSVGTYFRLTSASSDGRRVVMKRDMSHGDVFVARFDERHARLLETPKRLTSEFDDDCLGIRARAHLDPACFSA